MCNRFELILSIVVSICTIYYAFCIFKNTSKDTFQQPFVEGEKESLFYDPSTNPIINSLESNLKCELFRDAIMNPKVKKMGDFFYVNIGDIHDKITSFLIIYIIFTIIIIVFFFLSFFSSKLNIVCLGGFTCCIVMAIFVLIFTYLVVIYKILIQLYKSDIYNFVNLLSCKNINREAFGKHLYVEELQDHFSKLLFFCFLGLLLNKSSNNSNQNNSQEQKNQNEIELVEN